MALTEVRGPVGETGRYEWRGAPGEPAHLFSTGSGWMRARCQVKWTVLMAPAAEDAPHCRGCEAIADGWSENELRFAFGDL